MKLPVGTFTVRVDSLESFPAGSRFFLEDKGLPIGRDSLQDLLVNNVYTFSYNGPYNEIRTRFLIHCIPARVGVEEQLPSAGARGLEAFVFPNPAASSLNVRLVGNRGRASYKVVSARGAVVGESRAAGSTLALDVKDLAKGIYLIRVEESGRSTTRRFVKE